MSFLTSIALFAALLVGAPIAAHLLRRRRATEVTLPTASLLAATPPTARRRSALEDRALMSIRALAVLLLAILGATPFISCSHVSLLRKDGASVAMVIVLDDSLSMRAPHPNETSRFERARLAAIDLVDGGEQGDSFAIVLAGSESRVHLASTLDAAAARAALEDLKPSDRATDLAGALAIAKDLLKGAPQPDKRVVLLSDLADGEPEGPALEAGPDVTLWYPLADLEAKSEGDCGIVGTDRKQATVEVSYRCTGAQAERTVELVDAAAPGTPLSSATLDPAGEYVALKLPEGAPEQLDVRITGKDAIAEDDVAPVAAPSKQTSIGVLADAAASKLETGGAPPVEQAFAALELGSIVKPLPTIPEHAEELSTFAGLVIDDPPGFTPEERKSIAAWVEEGGILLMSLGKKAASAPLGSGFAGIVPGVLRWTSSPKGVTEASCGFFGPSAPGLADIAPKGRIQLQPEALKDAEVLCAFEDGQPLLLRRQQGRGVVFLSALPFDLEASDFPLRPAFFVLLDRLVSVARTGGDPKILQAGQRFGFTGAKSVQGDFLGIGDAKPVRVEVSPGPPPRADAARIGRYSFVVDGDTQTRVAVAADREVDLRPRALSPSARDPSLGGEARKMDASPYVALGVLVLLFLEIVLRLLLPPPKATGPEEALKIPV